MTYYVSGATINLSRSVCYRNCCMWIS